NRISVYSPLVDERSPRREGKRLRRGPATQDLLITGLVVLGCSTTSPPAHLPETWQSLGPFSLLAPSFQLRPLRSPLVRLLLPFECFPLALVMVRRCLDRPLFLRSPNGSHHASGQGEIMEMKEICNQIRDYQQPEDNGHIYHVFPWKPARQRSSSAKATALKAVRTACNRFQRARSSATRTLCKSSVGSSNCLLVGRMKASVKGIEAPRSTAPVAIHASRSCHAATRPRTRPTRASDTCMIVARL